MIYYRLEHKYGAWRDYGAHAKLLYVRGYSSGEKRVFSQLVGVYDSRDLGENSRYADVLSLAEQLLVGYELAEQKWLDNLCTKCALSVAVA